MNSLGFPILSLITLMPILCAIVIFFIPGDKVDAIKKTAIGFMGVNLLLTLFMFAQYNVSEGGMQFVENISCSDYLGINYIMAVDGISAPLMLLTSLIIFAGACISYDMNTRTKEFFIFLMILVCGYMAYLLHKTSCSSTFSSNWLSYQCTPSLGFGVLFVRITPL